MSRKKLIWICAVSWSLVANAVGLLLAGQNADATAWRMARWFSLILSGFFTPAQLHAILEFAWVISAIAGVAAVPVALAAAGALVGAFVTRYPGKEEMSRR